jgi:hypothetical protein
MSNVINLTLPLGAAELCRFADKSGDRPGISTIRIEIAKHRKEDKRRLTAIATDGHRLVRYSWLAADDTLQGGAVHLDASRIASLIKGTGRGSREMGFVLQSKSDQNGNDQLWLRNADGMGLDVSPCHSVSFPDWRQVMPKRSTEAGTLGVSASYIGDFAKYLKAIKVEDGVCVTSYGGADGLSPVMLEAPDVNPVGALRITYVVMPMRLDVPSTDAGEFTRVVKLKDVKAA